MNLRARLLIGFIFAGGLAVPAPSVAGDESDLPGAGAVTVGTIDTGSARVSAVLRLGKGDAAYWFQYWSAASDARQTPVAIATHEDDDKEHRVSVSRTISGLLPGTTYSVRLVAKSSEGSSVGAATSFTTTRAPGSTPAPPSPEPRPAPPGEATPPPPSDPALGTTFVAAAEQGTVRGRLPGSDRFVPLAQAASVPVGTVVDARAGAIALTTALPGGAVQRASLGGARFKVRQSPKGNGTTDLHLRGGSFAGCGRPARVTAAAAGKRPKPVRRMWGKDRSGRFRTHGRDSVTTVRGTEWIVADRCDGTVTRVTEGAVDVRVRRTGRVVRVDAGERFIARHRR